MDVVGYVLIVLLALAVLFALDLVTTSAPDVARYLRIRWM